MKRILINLIYYPVVGFKYFYIYTHNFFTFIYNYIAKALGWHVKFYKADEPHPKDTTLNKIKAFIKPERKDP